MNSVEEHFYLSIFVFKTLASPFVNPELHSPVDIIRPLDCVMSFLAS